MGFLIPQKNIWGSSKPCFWSQKRPRRWKNTKVDLGQLSPFERCPATEPLKTSPNPQGPYGCSYSDLEYGKVQSQHICTYAQPHGESLRETKRKQSHSQSHILSLVVENNPVHCQTITKQCKKV